MAVLPQYESTRPTSRDEARRRRRPRGPSAGVEAWTAYWKQLADWMIDARGRWHKVATPQKSGWRPLLGSGWLLALAAIVERLVGG